MMQVELLNGANLAFIGDAYYELYVRKHVLEKGITNQKLLHKTCVNYVSAKGHSTIMHKILAQLTEEEQSIFKRGRNAKVRSRRKNVDLSEYLDSSGFEALVGYLFLTNKTERLESILQSAIQIIEEQSHVK